MKVIVLKPNLHKKRSPDILLSEVYQQSQYFYEIAVKARDEINDLSEEIVSEGSEHYGNYFLSSTDSIFIHELKAGVSYALSYDIFLFQPGAYWGVVNSEDVFISQVHPEVSLDLGVYIKSNSNARWILDIRKCLLVEQLHIFDQLNPNCFPDIILCSSYDDLFLLPEYLIDRVEVFPKEISTKEMQQVSISFWYRFFIVKHLLIQKPWHLS